jgi:hypothetical protein
MSEQVVYLNITINTNQLPLSVEVRQPDISVQD